MTLPCIGLPRDMNINLADEICNRFYDTAKQHPADCDQCNGKSFPCREMENQCVDSLERNIKNILTSIRHLATYELSTNNIDFESYFMARRIFHVAEITRWHTNECCNIPMSQCQPCRNYVKTEIYQYIYGKLKRISLTYRFKHA